MTCSTPVLLSDVCQIKPPKKEAKGNLTDTDLVSFVPMNNLGICTKKIELSEERELGKVYGGYTYFADDDVLLAKITPCFENGKLGIARGLSNSVGFGSSEYIVFRAHENLDPEYLFYFLSRDSFRETGKKVMTGAVGHKRVPKEFIESLLIPLPQLPEQKRIVAILDEAFAGISQAVANAEKNLANARALFDSYLNKVFTQKGEGWVESRLVELGVITSSKRIFKREYTATGIPFYRTKEVKEKANGRDITTELFISEDRYKEIKEKFGIPLKGDVLLTAIGTIGEIYVVDGQEDFYFKDGNVLWLKEFKDVNSYFLRYVLMSFVENLKRLSHGAAYNALPIQKLKNHAIYLPPSNEQQSIVSKLDALQESTHQLEIIYQQKLSALAELKQSILQKAFAGELTAGVPKELVN